MDRENASPRSRAAVTWLVFSISVHVGLGAGLLTLSSPRVEQWLASRAQRGNKNETTSKTKAPLEPKSPAPVASKAAAPSAGITAAVHETSVEPATATRPKRRVKSSETQKTRARRSRRARPVHQRHLRRRARPRTPRPRAQRPRTKPAPATFACSLAGCQPLAVN